MTTRSHSLTTSRRTTATAYRFAALLLAIIPYTLSPILLLAQQDTYPPGKLPQRRTAALSELANDISTIISDRNFREASWGISVVSCDDPAPLFQFESHKNRLVASNIKLLTTATSLMRLGSSYQFSTDVYVTGALLPNGELTGNLVVRASGDPSFSRTFGIEPIEVFANWARILDSLGITSLRNIVVDASVFDVIPYAPGWSWDDEPYGFNAPISGVAICDNSVEIRVTPGNAPGQPVGIDVYPATSYVSIQVNAVTSPADSVSTLEVSRERGSSIITVSGNIAAGSEPYSEQISIESPPLFYATLLKEALIRQGLTIHGSPLDAKSYNEPQEYGSMRHIIHYRSPELGDIAAVINKHSMNLAAEMLVKKLGRTFTGTGSTSAGVEVIKDFLAENDVDTEHLHLVDGSGLSRQNLIAPDDITTFLRKVERTVIGRDFIASLSVAGKDGTLGNRLAGTQGEGNVFGKTGYLNGIRAVSGYVRTPEQEWIAFSIVTNNYTIPTSVVNTAQDLILMRLASFARNL